MSPTESRGSFLRQSGWMIVATFAGGIFMFAVHVFAPFMPEKEYGLFGTLLQILNLMMIPALGLQMVFAQQAAAAIEERDQTRLRAAVRTVACATFLIWIAMVALAALYQSDLISTLKISNPAALWMTVALGLPQLWSPIALGLLQGRQQFLWLGTATILNGVGRFAAVAVIVVWLGGHAAGAITGAWIGLMLGTAVAAWHCRSIWLAAGSGFKWRPWLDRIVPLTLGLGASQFMVAADMIMVRSVYEVGTGLYAGAGMFGRGLVVFTAPVALVVFPKIVRSLAQARDTDVLWVALLATGLMGGLAALGCSVAAWSVPWFLDWIAGAPPSWVLPLGQSVLPHREALLTVAGLVPPFVGSMLPFALANILIYNLLARERYRAVPWLVLVAAAYGTALTVFHSSFLAVIRTIGVFSVLLFLTALGFSLPALRGRIAPKTIGARAP